MHYIDQISINFNESQVLLLNICLGFLMFGVAMDLQLDHFKKLTQNIKSILIGLTSQWILLPGLTLLLIWVIKPHISIAMGMLLVSACPGGNVSNYAVHLSGANTYLSLILTTISTILCALTTPIIFGSLSHILPYNQIAESTFTISIPDMIFTIVQLILIPLILGMSLAHLKPVLTSKIKNAIKKISLFIFSGFVLGGLFTNLSNMYEYLHLVFWIVLIHNSLALLGGYFFAALNSLPEENCRTISIETGIQNSGLALVLIFNFFDGLGGMALIAAWWSIWHLISASGLAFYWSKYKTSVSGMITKK